MDKAYYKEYHDLERTHWWFQVRGEILMDHLRGSCPSTPLRILNVGAATGRTSELLGEFGDVCSIEYDEDCCRFAREQSGIAMEHGSILELPFQDGSFDLVCAFDVLEHVVEHQRGALELERVCKPGGTICVTVPAYQFLWSKHDDVNHHLRRYTRGELAELFSPRLEPVYQSYFNSLLFGPIASFRLLSALWPFQAKERADAGSDFFVMNMPMISRLFYHVFRLERHLIARGIALPVGVSILSSWRKPSPSGSITSHSIAA